MLMVGHYAAHPVALFFNNGGPAPGTTPRSYIEAGAPGEVPDGGRTAHHQEPHTRQRWSGDTVGDPFKDTAGPVLHVLIKLLSTITLVMAPSSCNGKRNAGSPSGSPGGASLDLDAP